MQVSVTRVVTFIVSVIVGWGAYFGVPDGILDIAQDFLLYAIPLVVVAMPGVEKWKNLFELVAAVVDYVEASAAGKSNPDKESLAIELVKEYASKFNLGIIIRVLVVNSRSIRKILLLLVPVVKWLLRTPRAKGVPVPDGTTLLESRLREINKEESY